MKITGSFCCCYKYENKMRESRQLFVKETMTFIFFFLALFLISLLCPLITYNTGNIKMAF